MSLPLTYPILLFYTLLSVVVWYVLIVLRAPPLEKAVLTVKTRYVYTKMV